MVTFKLLQMQGWVVLFHEVPYPIETIIYVGLLSGDGGETDELGQQIGELFQWQRLLHVMVRPTFLAFSVCSWVLTSSFSNFPARTPKDRVFRIAQVHVLE